MLNLGASSSKQLFKEVDLCLPEKRYKTLNSSALPLMCSDALAGAGVPSSLGGFHSCGFFSPPAVSLAGGLLQECIG